MFLCKAAVGEGRKLVGLGVQEVDSHRFTGNNLPQGIDDLLQGLFEVQGEGELKVASVERADHLTLLPGLLVEVVVFHEDRHQASQAPPKLFIPEPSSLLLQGEGEKALHLLPENQGDRQEDRRGGLSRAAGGATLSSKTLPEGALSALEIKLLGKVPETATAEEAERGRSLFAQVNGRSGGVEEQLNRLQKLVQEGRLAESRLSHGEETVESLGGGGLHRFTLEKRKRARERKRMFAPMAAMKGERTPAFPRERKAPTMSQ
ncbi:MAG: hypothetical protein BWY86_00714 [Candidatus Aminicenantes bacterium ADurb.Bin508]|nr:MAG: hypothetical protein BWY86_00714 [Candidatus Aminicenantes bacterium ADurb.Bin508]